MHLDPKTVHAPEIGQIWLNSPPLSIRSLRGRVVLVDFWDFTCVNCIRTLPYLKQWHSRYQPMGLTTIGVHSPEFYFSHAAEIVTRGMEEFGIEYPVVLDNDFTVWKSFANRYWPSKYLIDKDGYLRYHHAGEGAYQETEEAIQALLLERDPSLKMPAVMPLMRELDKPGALAYCEPPTPEIYLGSARGKIANAEGFIEDKVHQYMAGAGPQPDIPELQGAWLAKRDALESAGKASVYLFFSAAEVNLVMSPTAAAPVIRVNINENGAPVAEAGRGDDIQVGPQGQTYVEVRRPRMYSLIRRNSFANHLLEITTETAGLQAFAFTFVSCMP